MKLSSANDGLLPPMFAEIDDTGNPRKGALCAGVLMTIFPTCVPFKYLDDFVSAGILIAFTTTNCSLILMRRESPQTNPYLLQKLLGLFNLCSFLTCMAVSHLPSPLNLIIGAMLGFISILVARKMSRQCPPMMSFGNSTGKNNMYGDKKYFSTPLVPYIPCLACFANYLLIAQLSFLGIVILFAYALLAVLIYFLYGAHNSVGREENWEQEEYTSVEGHERNDDGVLT